MHRWLRNTHLLLGLFSFLFLLMYGVSSVHMAHNTWFAPQPKPVESRLDLRPGADARAAARELMERGAARGELAQVRKTAAGTSFRVIRPGTVCEVDYSAQTGEARLRILETDFIGMLNRLHHVQGLWHQYWLINAWGFFVGLASVSLILLGLTGIYLWFKIHAERLAGAILLAASLGYSLALMVLLRSA